MQTFSYMQRNISNKRDLNNFLIIFSLIIYEEVSTIHNYLPPLFGFVFIVFLNSIKSKNRFLIFTTTLYLLFFEADRDFLLFSSIIFFVISIYYIEPKLKSVIHCNRCLIPIFVFWSYIGYYLFINLINFIFNIPLNDFHALILYYALVETMLAFLLL